MAFRVDKLLRRIRFLLHRRTMREELAEEMRLHRELRAESEPEKARLFGSETLLLEKSAEAWGWMWLDDLWRDLRHARRLLANQPGFAAAAILTLALGIGANTAIFSLTNALLLRLLPVRHADRIVRVSCTGIPAGAGGTGNTHASFSYYVFEQLRTVGKPVAEFMAYVPLSFGKTSVRVGALPEEAAVDMVSGNFFSGLEVNASCGRLLGTDDERQHRAAAVVTERFAIQHFGSACAAVGRRIVIKGKPFVIAGTTSGGFRGVSAGATDLWIPFGAYPDLNAWGLAGSSYLADAQWWCLGLVARLQEGESVKAAEAALNPAFIRAAYEPLGGKPARNEAPAKLILKPARGIPGNEDLEKSLLAVQAMVGLLLMIACGNVATLLAVRNASRTREFSVRLAIGGSTGRLLRQLMAEALTLVAAGTGLGLAMAFAATTVLARWAELDFAVRPDRTVLLFTLAVAVAATLIFGITSAVRSWLIPATGALKVTSSISYERARAFATGTVVTALQIAFCLTLLVAMGLLVRTLQNLRSVPLGLDANKLLVFGINPNLQERQRALAFYRGLIEKLRSVPEVQSVTLAGLRLGSGWSNVTDTLIDGRPASDVDNDAFRWNQVGPNFFGTLGIQLIAGRDFNDGDGEKAPLVAVVDRRFAKQFFGGRSPLGHTISYTRRKEFTVVGVVADSKYSGIKEDPLPMAWFPYTQAIDVGTMQVEIRSAVGPMAILPRVRKAVAEYARDLALLEPKSQQAAFDSTIANETIVARLATAFAVLAGLLVAIGLYGVISYGVARRTNEIGVRLAVGADTGRVLWMILRRGLLLSAVGVAIGIPMAIGASRVLGSLLYGVAPGDPVSLGAALGLLLAIAMAAAYVPARRASHIDPMRALRWE